jgi:hypothetical protein
MVDALGSAGSALLAGVAGYIALKLYKVESERDRRAALRERSQQASLVAAWYGEYQREEYDLDDDSYVGTTKLVVVNLSALPVYNVVATLGTGRVTTHRIEAFPPGQRTFTISSKFNYSDNIVLEFRDNAGIDWTRDSYGLRETYPASERQRRG